MNYIQVHTGIQFAKVTRVDGKEKVAFGLCENAPHTTCLDHDRAKKLALDLLSAANHAARQFERSQREFMESVEKQNG